MHANVEKKPAVDQIEAHKAITVVYTNWRGQTDERRIIPQKIYWGKTEWHKEEQWLVEVYDLDRNALRQYALGDIKEIKK